MLVRRSWWNAALGVGCLYPLAGHAQPALRPTSEQQASEQGASGQGASEQQASGQQVSEQRASKQGEAGQEVLEVNVDEDTQAKLAPARSASEFVVERELLSAAPRSEGADVLLLAPGLSMGRGEGASVAHNYFLRGFDSAHGQDIEFKVGGIPINLPVHLHGQGYSDLGFLLADSVYQLRVQEGVYDAGQGDFAVAGSIGIELGVAAPERGLRISGGYGRWGRIEQRLMWAPRQGNAESFAAMRYTQTRGFGQNRASTGVSATVQHRFVHPRWSHRLLGIVHSSRANSAGVLRRDDVQAGRIGFFDVYPHATARAQNAFAQRVMVGAFSDYKASKEAQGQIGLWASLDNFRSQQNFTGFIEQSRVLNRVGGRGDLIEQRNQTLSTGISGRYRGPTWRPRPGISARVRAGIQGRMDLSKQQQSLLDGAVRNQTWDRRVDAEIRGVDLGTHASLDTRLGEKVKLQLGARANVLSYEIDDKLSNLAPNTRPKDQFIPGFRRSAQGMTLGPRFSFEYAPTAGFSLHAAYGQGYRSAQARTLSDGEDAPYTKVHSADLGVGYRLARALKLSASAYYTHLSDDVAFEASEGRLERIGASQRFGATLFAQARPTSWLVASGSATWVRAILLEPPPPTASEPLPPFEEGQFLPFVPPLVLRADLGVRRVLFGADNNALVGRAGLGFSFLSPRPLPFGDFADPVSVLDMRIGLDWKALSLGVEFLNLLDTRYSALEYSFASDWDPNDGVRPRTPARHGAAGAPFSWFLTLGIQL